MTKRVTAILGALFLMTIVMTGHRRWTVTDGLPTGEIRQIIELPNGQMLVNCEGVFCLSNGQTFDACSCDQSCAYPLPHFNDSYGHIWQGDSLLWLRDLYHIYLFDARNYRFRTDIRAVLSDTLQQRLLSASADAPVPTASQFRVIDSLDVQDVTVATPDRQGGLWIGTLNSGIVYQPPRRVMPEIHTGSDTLIGLARGATLRVGSTTFVVPLPDGRVLRCDSLCHLNYALPESPQRQPLAEQLPALRNYRIMVGACPLDERWVAIYTQNGIFRLDIQADTLAPFPCAEEIERHSNKYNCLLKDSLGRLWVGTQNGLFCLSPNPDVQNATSSYTCRRVEGLINNCIRSLVVDADGRLWAGTSYGISRITPAIINLGTDDGFPAIAMMDRAAVLLPDGRLVFAAGGGLAVAFQPRELIGSEEPAPVVVTTTIINGERVQQLPAVLSHSQNYITFEFSTLNYATPSHDRYRYRMRGLENEWNFCNDGLGLVRVSYKALSPGDYVLEVQAASASADWGPRTEIPFTITPPWWLTWWAKFCYILLTLAGVVSLINLYLSKRKAKLERENEQRVNRLFELREEARHQFAESVNIAADKISINAEEEKMVENMLQAIKEHLDDETYNADQLARDLAMSRASLYKKLQTMLGITPTDFIRNVRLKRAAQLLAETSLNINEIAAQVGFATPRNFSTQFKKMFGMTPSEYREPSGGGEGAPL
ncbi:MAG: helix-turn-helix domain-containing protein [Bacteroidaceae bacterium]|nr:helix-turn-helix domain-containing protein [Bacteroidaceae bacterium]